MDTKTLAAMAAAILATSTWAASPADKSCAAASGCSKKEQNCQPGQDCGPKDAACSKKDAACSKK